MSSSWKLTRLLLALLEFEDASDFASSIDRSDPKVIVSVVDRGLTVVGNIDVAEDCSSSTAEKAILVRAVQSRTNSILAITVLAWSMSFAVCSSRAPLPCCVKDLEFASCFIFSSATDIYCLVSGSYLYSDCRLSMVLASNQSSTLDPKSFSAWRGNF